MLPFIEKIDKICFFYLNQEWRTPFLDLILPYCRVPKTWLPLYVFLLFYVLKKLGKKSIIPVIVIIFSVGLSDTVNSRFIKPLVHRLRPCNEPTQRGEVINIVPCGSGYSFASSHAANHFAIAISLCLFFFQDKKNIQYLLVFWASLVCYAQVYVGVHYPFDVFCGAVLGSFLAKIIYFLFQKFRRSNG
jgi:membrane-associated phospholipid phosphatase